MMKVKKIEPVKATLTAAELLEEKGMTKDEWNEMLKQRIEEIKADESMSEERKADAIAQLWGMMIVERDGELRFALEHVVRGLGNGQD